MPLAQTGAGSAEVAPGYARLRVKSVVRETADACSIILDVPADLAGDFAYQPGQFLTFRVMDGGRPLLRCYSLASTPRVDADLKVTVKRVPQGRVSNWLLDNVQAGDSLMVMPPKGVFRLRERASPVVLFGAGSGITPIISILKQILSASARKVALIYANRDARSIIFRHELEKLREAHEDRFTLVHRLDDADGPLTPADVAAYVRDDGADFYICGPAPFMQAVRSGLQALPIPDGQVFMESFTAEPDAEGVQPAAAPAPGSRSAKVAVRYHGLDHLIEVAEAESVHAAAARQGLNLPFSCKAGYCGLCIARVASGTVRLAGNLGAISDAQIAAGLTLACQAHVESPEATLIFE